MLQEVGVKDGSTRVEVSVSPLVTEPDPSSSSQMEEIPLSPPSCVTSSPMLDPPQYSIEGSSSDRVGDDLHDTASGLRNLGTKKIVAFWSYRVEDRGYGTIKTLGKRMRKNQGCVNDSGGGVWMFQQPTR